MKTDIEKQAQQLELAAQLLRTGHPWEYKNHQDKWVPQSVTSLEECTLSGREIRPVLVTPDDGRKLNNPDNLTAEQVGVGYKLTLEEQMDGTCHSEGEWWNNQSWVKPVNYTGWFWPKNDTIRIPLSTPWPEAKPDLYDELKSAHAEGKMIQHTRYRDGSGGWVDTTGEIAWCWPIDCYRIKPWTMPKPPAGKQWHKPGALTQQDWEDGWRPLLLGEEIIEGDKVWSWGEGPWVTPVQSGGKVTGDNHSFRTKRPLPVELVKPEPKYGPLEPEDVPPGSAIKHKGCVTYRMVTSTVIIDDELYLCYASVERTSAESLMDNFLIFRPGQTEWLPCRKEVQP